MAHTVLQLSGYLFSQSRDPRGQILEPFLARLRYTIPRADPTVLLRPGSNGYSPSRFSRPRDLEYPIFGLSPCELPSSRDLSISATCPSQMDGSDRSRDFHHENSRSHVIVTPDFTNVDIPISRNGKSHDTCPPSFGRFRSISELSPLVSEV
jgi:hypothetical protein